MSRPYFEEYQSFRQTRWIWYVIIPFTIILLLPIGLGLYQQIFQGIPWGDKPMSDSSLILVLMLCLVSAGFAITLLLSVKLVTRVDVEGIHYRFFPQRSKWRIIRKEDVVQFEVRRNLNFFASGGIGYHKNIFRKTVSMTIQGGIHLWLKLYDGNQLIIGTQNPEALERSVKRLFSKEVND